MSCALILRTVFVNMITYLNLEDRFPRSHFEKYRCLDLVGTCRDHVGTCRDLDSDGKHACTAVKVESNINYHGRMSFYQLECNNILLTLAVTVARG